jgi:hypothetical protein
VNPALRFGIDYCNQCVHSICRRLTLAQVWSKLRSKRISRRTVGRHSRGRPQLRENLDQGCVLGKKTKSIIVTVTDDALTKIDELAARLTAKGMKVDRVLPATGVITGSAAPTKMSTLKKVDGVMSVEEELTIELAPPDSPVQ